MTVAYSVIIPAFNEEAFLPRTLAALGEAMRGIDLPGEVIVVDNNSTDGTSRVAGAHGAQVVFEPENQISRARNAGARHAGGDYLVFLDADSVLPAELLGAALSRLASGRCCGGGSLVEFDRPLPGYGRWLQAIWNRISRHGRLAAGCFIFCLRRAFDDVGGFSQRVYASEEIWLSRRLAQWGRPRGLSFDILSECRVITSARRMEGSPADLLGLLLVIVFPLGLLSRRMSHPWYPRRKRTAPADAVPDNEGGPT